MARIDRFARAIACLKRKDMYIINLVEVLAISFFLQEISYAPACCCSDVMCLLLALLRYSLIMRAQSKENQGVI